jgi:hypothetical protein
MGGILGDAAVFALMALAFAAGFAARALSAAARDRVRAHHPAWYEALRASGRGLRVGTDDEHVRRRLTRPMLLGRLPPGAAGDAELAKIASWFSFAITATLAAMGGLFLILWLRAGQPAA